MTAMETNLCAQIGSPLFACEKHPNTRTAALFVHMGIKSCIYDYVGHVLRLYAYPTRTVQFDQLYVFIIVECVQKQFRMPKCNAIILIVFCIVDQRVSLNLKWRSKNCGGLYVLEF